MSINQVKYSGPVFLEQFYYYCFPCKGIVFYRINNTPYDHSLATAAGQQQQQQLQQHFHITFVYSATQKQASMAGRKCGSKVF